MENVARVVLALEAHDVAEEVMHFLDRSGRARVIATASDDRQLLDAVRQLDPDVIVAQPSLVHHESLRGRTLLALDTSESVASLRAAVAAGANGFYVWPGDREDLAAAVAGSLAASVAPERRATVVAVHGARGGVGATFAATHLAAAFARRGADCVLIDADPVFADVSLALGAPAGGVHTFADLLPMLGELSPTHLRDALWSHPSGFGVLLAPAPEEAAGIGAVHLRAVTEIAASATDAVVLHLPRGLDELARTGFELADRILEILGQDVFSFRAAARAIEAGSMGTRVGFVLNRVTRAEITPGDVARVFGSEPLVVIPLDRAVERAQEQGRLRGGRIGRAFDRLAAALS